jgi:hypothetical protein
MNNHSNALKRSYINKSDLEDQWLWSSYYHKKLHKQKWPRRLITMKFILLESANYLNKNHKLHIKFATTLANTRTYGGIEPLKLTVSMQVIYKINQVSIQL